jgi:N-acetylglutamate synthase-like GNAT family acetyltransferase
MEIGYLKDHKTQIPMIAQWFYREWGWFYPDLTVRDLEKRFMARAHKTVLPLALVALDKGQVVGTVSLKDHDMDTRPHYSPWLASLYVCARSRVQGVGQVLVHAGITEARKLGLEQLYLYTLNQRHILFYTTRGWSFHEKTVYRNEDVYIVYRKV